MMLRARAAAFGGTLAVLVPLESALAQPSGEDLGTVVFTASRRETELRFSPAAVSVITRRDIERRGGSSIAELLRDVPGVQIDESSIPGLKRIRIRGEDARRSLVLIDGQETTDHTTYGPPMLIDPALIERIEVIRGPLSVLYGSRAIGGVVNIITKKPVNRMLGVELGSGYDSATRGYVANGLASGTIGNFNYRVFAGRTEDKTRITPQGALPNMYYGTRSFDLRLGFDDGTHALSAGYDRFGLTSRSSTPAGTVDGVFFTKFQLDMPQRDREKWSAFYEGRNLLPWMSRLSANAYHQVIDRRFLQEVAGLLPTGVPPGRYDFKHADTDQLATSGATFQTDLSILPNNILIAGLQYLKDAQDRSASRTGTYDPFGPPPPSPINTSVATNSSIASTSVYAQNTWSFAPGWQLVGGVRQYWVETALEQSSDPLLAPNSRSDKKLIASASMLWTPIDPLTLRVGWGQGYIVPTLLQLHTGSFFGSGFTVRPNPSLVPETSNSYEFGARWNDGTIRLDGTVYYNESQNYIATAPCATVPGITCLPGELAYTNINAAKTYGAEVAAGYKFMAGFELYGSMTAMRRQYVYTSFSTFKAGVPEWWGRAGLRYETVIDRFDLWWDAYVRGATQIELESSSRTISQADGWTTVNLEFGGTFKEPTGPRTHSLSVAFTNIGNVTYRSSLEELTAPGRAIRLNYRLIF
ncbi:MAG: TonB-dependent receptor [Hyphomicrobiales bacterium]|nr:TonB-dependent receptor [Hyphomicrobiales bacterium]